MSEILQSVTLTILESALWLFMTVSEFAFLWDFQIEIQFNDISLCASCVFPFSILKRSAILSGFDGHCADTMLSQKKTALKTEDGSFELVKQNISSDKAYEFSCVVVVRRMLHVSQCIW